MATAISLSRFPALFHHSPSLESMPVGEIPSLKRKETCGNGRIVVSIHHVMIR